MDQLLLSFLGVPSAMQGVTLFQGTLEGAQAAAASEILTRSDEARAAVLLRQIVEGLPAERLLARVSPRSGDSPRRTLFDSPPSPTEQARTVLRGGLSFAELVMELAAALERKDSEASVILLENAGVVSNEVCRSLRADLIDPETVEVSKRDLALSVLKRANVFVTQLAKMLVDPSIHEFPDITHHPSSLDVQMLLRFVEDRRWVATEIFGRITILTVGELKDFLLGKEKRFLHPSIKIFSGVEVKTTPAASVAPAPAATLPQPMLMEIAAEFPTAVIPHMEGALILAPQLPAKLQDPTIPYKLLRRVVYRALSEERFEEAARMVENISDEFVLARLFDDLRMKIGDEANHLPHSQLFFANTAIYVGRMLDQMNPETVVSLLLVLNQHVRWHDQKALDQWLLLAFRAIRSRSEEEGPGSMRPLPRLSVILGTLMEWEETRELARRLLQTGLNRQREAYGEIYDALDALHERSEAFLHPLEIEANGAAEIYDENKAAADLGIAAQSRILKSLAAMMGQRAPIAPHFDPPRRSLASREAVFARLLRKLEAIGGKPGEMPKNLEAISALILFALPPADVWRLMQAATSGKEVGKEAGPSQFLAELLIVQPTEVVLAFFAAWGRGLAEDEEVAPLGRALVALWRTQGEVGPRLVTDVVDAALNDDTAVAVLQRALSQHGTDTALIWDQAEIYVGLSERLGEKINSYEIFVTTGVLRPGDLSGQFRKQAIEQSMKVLEDDQTRWRRTALETLVKLGADEKAVVNYLVSQLEGPHGRLYYDALDRMGPRAQDKLVARIRRVAEEPIFKEPAFPDSRVFDTTKRVLADLIQRFPLSSRAMQRYLIERLQKESGIYEKEIKKSENIDRIVAGDVATPAIVKELAELGDEALVLVSAEAIKRIGGWNKTEQRGSPREALTWEHTIPSFVLPPLVHLAECIGTSKAHQSLVDLYKFAKDHNGTPTQRRILLRALARLESKPGYDGPLAVVDYLNGDADFMEKLEILDYLENQNPLFDATAFAEMPFAIRHEKNPFLNKLLGQIIDSAFYLFVIRALKDDVMRQTFLNWHTNSDDVGGQFPFESTRTGPTIVYIAKDESPENLQREIAIHTLFWYFRRVHTCGFRDPLLGVLEPPLMKLLKQIEPTLKELCASRAACYADPEDVYYFRSRVEM